MIRLRRLPFFLCLTALLGACGSGPVLTDRDGGADASVPDDAQLDGGRGDTGPPPIDGGPECLGRDPIAPEDPTAGEWEIRFGNPGVGGDQPNVEAFAFDADGHVYVGGRFTSAGYQPASNIARWDGASGWHALGAGLPGPVRSIVVAPGGDVIASHGTEPGRDATRISRWDGTAWATVADVEGASPDDWGIEVAELAFVGDTLFAVGRFARIAGVAIDDVAYFDGSAWSGYAGLQPDFGSVNAISATALDDVCIGGAFTDLGIVRARGVACWNGTAWQGRSFGDVGHLNDVFDLVRRPTDGVLIAVGDFMLDDTNLNGGSVAEWDGAAWRLLGGGVMTELGPGTTRSVRGAVFTPHGMYAAGAFVLVNPPDPFLANGAARWNGTAWEDIGGLFKEAGGIGLNTNNVHAIGVGPDGSVYFGGLFTRAGSTRVAHVVRYDGTYWSGMRTPGETYEGVGGRVWALSREGACAVYVGGEFEYAGGVRANNVARYTREGGYEALGTGVQGAVADLAAGSGGLLYASGAFIDGNTGTEFANVAVWNGSSWEALGPSVDGMAWGIALDRSTSPDQPDRVYVAGDFAMAGDQPARRIAMWDGTEWTDLGAGIEGFSLGTDPPEVSHPYLYDVIVDPETHDVYIAGTFRFIGEDDARIEANNVARWDGERWHALGNGLGDLFGAVGALVLHEGQLVAGGAFRESGTTVVSQVARWNGTAWEAVGTAGPDGSMVAALDSIGGALYVGGNFEMAGENAHVAVYDGTAWSDLNAGMSDIVEALVVADEGVYVGGAFNRAGESASVGLALWRFTR